MQELEAENKEFEDILNARFQMFGVGQDNNLDWIYKHNIGQVWKDYLKGQKEDHSS